MPAGPMCLRCNMVSPSGPVVEEFLHCRMMVAVWSGEKGVKLWSMGWLRLTWRRVRRRSGSLEWTVVLVNSLVKYLAIAEGLVQVLVLPSRVVNEMGWFGGTLVLLPERLRIVFQNLLILDLCEMEEMNVLHLVRAVALVRVLISLLRMQIAGSAGSSARRASRSSMRR